MKLPDPARTVVDIEKLRNYCLNSEHPRGRHKARVFAATLGLTATDAEELREILLKIAQSHEAIATEKDEYGQRYVIEFELVRRGKRAKIHSGWIVRRGEDFARLTSCYVI